MIHQLCCLSSLASAWWITTNQSPTQEKRSCSLQQLGEKPTAVFLSWENPMDRRDWWATLGITKSQMRLSTQNACRPPLLSNHLFIYFDFFILYWNTVALQCCKFPAWQSERLYVYKYPSLDFFHLGHHRASSRSSLIYCSFSSVIYFICNINSVHMLIPVSQFLPPSSHPFKCCNQSL